MPAMGTAQYFGRGKADRMQIVLSIEDDGPGLFSEQTINVMRSGRIYESAHG